jgi:NhaA family Na+:H+ antiporter
MQSESVPTPHKHLPVSPVERWLRPFAFFLHLEAASGVFLLSCTAAALLLANSPWADAFLGFWQTPGTIAIGDFGLTKPLILWINDGLMTLFFFVIGLEIKREIVGGELGEPRKAALPIFAALGGMLVPAAIYFALQWGRPGEPGWGIPMATDIAFVVGVLALLGPRVPLSLKILLLTLAIADDIGAILVIAVFYSTNVSLAMLGWALGGFGVVLFFNRIGVRSISVYVVVGAGIWLAFLKSGVHPTIAGVLLGLLTPGSAWIGGRTLTDIISETLHLFDSDDVRAEHETLHPLSVSAREAISPLERLERGLHPWVAFGIMPLFALANAGVAIDPQAVREPISTAVALGLVLGKPIGIVLFSWLALAIGLARLPSGITWPVLAGGGCLAGIGFTMSLFIAGLAFPGQPELLDPAKLGILLGSVISAVLGSIILLRTLPKRPTDIS